MSQIDLNRLIEALEPDLRVSLEAAASVAARRNHRYVDIAHWLCAVVENDRHADVLTQLKIPLDNLRAEIDRALDDAAIGDGDALSLSQNVLTTGREAWLLASLQDGRSHVDLVHLILALDEEASLRSLVRAAFPSLKLIDRAALQTLREEQASQPTGKGKNHDTSPLGAQSKDQNDFLRLYTQDMTEDARQGKVDPVIGRDDELRQMIDILTRRRQNNPILVGEAGVGKTAVAEALALEIVSGNVPEKLRDVRLLSLDLSLLQAGAGVKGEFERRLHGVIDAVKRSPEPIILFIDEAHALVGAGGAAGQGDAANILKPALARGEVRTVAATTWSEYKKYFEKDAALTRRFQPVHVREPDEATAIRMLRGVADTFIKHHDVTIRDEAIVAAVQLSARYMPARQLPDKAVSLLDTAAAAVSLARQTLPEKLRNMESEKRLLATELEWLSREASDEDNVKRTDAINSEIAGLETAIDGLRARYDAEILDLSQAEGSDAAVTDVSNIAPLRPLAVQSDSQEERLVPLVVDREMIAAVVSRWTGIPLGKLLADQIESAKTLDERMKQRVIGQDWAIDRIADAMRAARAGLSDPRRPPAVFMLVGMSGTGKTETALSLADLLYGGNGHLTTINMSEFKEEHKVSLLLGSPPGYVGYGEGGVLTEAVRRRPFGVLLLDEIDKAHPGVQDIFYQVFDKGMLKDGEGRDIDFKNTTIFMTANTGSELLTALSADPDTMPEGEALEALLMPELTKQFKPAFLGRTVILPFMPLGSEQLSRIVDIQIRKIAERVRTAYGTELELSAAAREALVGRAGSSEIGARAIEIMIGRDLLPPLSSFFLEKVIAGEKVKRVTVDFDETGFGIRADEVGNMDEFAAAPAAEVDKVAASDGVSRRMRH
ncbi:type VI secretion system ATPase TssH [Agrobacterium rubi]|uniref:type VI secretion system ATPase TssH n=1 Tax=Agrobacterium rubi TaxID=28099 RepID=UPI0005EAFB04|nr:type VI secretion system ATPase TssH [Agrobacterium rubi]MBP1878640.1 type VI secretion system protein VasG [Agrobacterium rubi]MCL6652999.1 ClpV1 family T6SS ATPase [Agrobacterium rubi]NTF10097.1 type VI secretion system ATPase TssH [Agrobacterium rubi]NTF21725.1 type VI secretion system ATPase TssH [Agrobacterium rubi]NTF28582.1 type VI secretion system ATPase TssH [Agrobacterium rubi]